MIHFYSRKRELFRQAVMNAIKGVATAAASAVTSSFLDTPTYEVTKKDEIYEERCYPETVWISTGKESISKRECSSELFYRCFNYISGKNDKKERIDMTAPVLTKILPGAGPNCESTFTMSFYLSTKHWENPPQPDNELVKIDRKPAMTCYVRQFGGMAKEDDVWIKEASVLSEALEKQGINDFDKDYYFTAGYDAPFKLFNRRNEIWFIKKGETS